MIHGPIVCAQSGEDSAAARHRATRIDSVEFDVTSASTHLAHHPASAFDQPDESCCSGCTVGTKGCTREQGGTQELVFQSSPHHLPQSVLLETSFEILGPVANVAGRVDVFVFERVI